VPVQGRHALTRVGVPELDGPVCASTGYCAVGTPCHRPDPAFDESAHEATQAREEN
jgi:hypothetical protein